MLKCVLLSILDNWRERVVPVLWAAFIAGVLMALSVKIDDITFKARSAGLSREAREAIRADFETLIPLRLGLFDAWAAEQRRIEGTNPEETAGALSRYFSRDGGALFVLGSSDAARLFSWAGRIRARFHPRLVFSFLAVSTILSSLMILLGSGRRIWRTSGYFSSRLLVFSIFFWVFAGLIEALGNAWLMGSAMASMPSLPSAVPLWGMIMASGPVMSVCLDLATVCCLSVGLGAVYPDP